MKSTTKNYVSNSLNLRVLVGIGEKCRTYLLVIFAFLLTALPGWAQSVVVQESVTIANTDGGLKYKLYSDYTATLLGATSEDISVLNIPASVIYEEQEYKVTKIGDDAFEVYPSLKSISGGENITEIGVNAFHGCSALIGYIEFNKVTNIGEGAFWECGNGELNLTFNNLECKTIGHSAFKSFNGTVNLDGNVNYIVGNAFYNDNYNNNFQVNANLRGITRIDGDNFHDIKGGNISLEVNNVNIGPYTFSSCNASINISGTIQNINQWAFNNCNAGINISGTIQNIKQWAFDSCNETIIELYNSSIISIDENPNSRGYISTIYVLPTLVEEYKTKGINDTNFEALSDNQAKTINGVKYAVRSNAAGFEVIGTEDGASFADGIVNIIDNIYDLPVTSIRADAFNGQEISCILVPELRYDSIHSNAGKYADKVFVDRGKVNIVDGDNTTLTSSDKTCYLPGDITYNRTFSEAGQYATMCLPFDLPVTNAQEKFEQVYVAQGNIIHNTSTDMYILMLLNPEGESIPAGTPFFVKTKDTNVTLQNNVLCRMTTTPISTPLTVVDWDGKSGLMTQCPNVNVTCSGTLAARTDFDETYYTFNTDGSFGNRRADANFPAYRMYLNITNKSNQAAPILMSIGIFDDDDNTTGILNVLPVVLKKSAAEGTFTIDGRAVKGTLSKGLYIVNGKKVVVE
ncbi:MAG: leucine-rich repeat domain-containing protein [Prevotella sp.]|nr:leucine-rich repeat domain-containing protein [Prevotella sp.]